MAPVIGLKAMLGEVLEGADTMVCRSAEKAKLSAKTGGFSSLGSGAPAGRPHEWTGFRRPERRQCRPETLFGCLAMLRLTELRLPIDHAPEALLPAIAKRLGLAAADVGDFTVFKRSYDARKAAQLTFIYTVDVSVKNEAAVLKKLGKDRNVGLAPDTAYHFVSKAPENLKSRPVVVGFGPCGIFAALLLAQMGFKPIVLERGKAVRERTQDTWGLSRTCSLAKAVPVPFPTASSTARSRTRATSGARSWPSLSDSVRRKRFSTSPNRTSAPFGWSAWSSRCGRRSLRWVARSVSSSA
jgi:chorismate mutase